MQLHAHSTTLEASYLLSQTEQICCEIGQAQLKELAG